MAASGMDDDKIEGNTVHHLRHAGGGGNVERARVPNQPTDGRHQAKQERCTRASCQKAVCVVRRRHDQQQQPPPQRKGWPCGRAGQGREMGSSE